MPPPKKVVLVESEEELLDMDRAEATAGLQDKEILFCQHYLNSYNMKTACLKAGFTPNSSVTMAYQMRKKYKVNRYIAWLKLRVLKECHVEAIDIINKYIKIAFSDITDFVKIKDGKLTLYDDENIDGQLIKSVKKGRDGIAIELYDKLEALKRLEMFFSVMPKDWKQKIEERKLELMQEKLTLEKQKAGFGDIEHFDDGFIDALRDSAEDTWEGDE